AVVGDTDPPDPAAGEIDVDLRRAGVERVLEELLQSGRRALDDLPGRDLVDQQIGKRANLRHRDCRARTAPLARETLRPARVDVAGQHLQRGDPLVEIETDVD